MTDIAGTPGLPISTQLELLHPAKQGIDCRPYELVLSILINTEHIFRENWDVPVKTPTQANAKAMTTHKWFRDTAGNCKGG